MVAEIWAYGIVDQLVALTESTSVHDVLLRNLGKHIGYRTNVLLDHMRNDEIRRIVTFSRSTRLCTVAVFVGLDKSKEERRTPSLAE